MIKAFISYAHEDKERAADIKTAFKKLGVESFLAHQTLDVSDDWRKRILNELCSSQIFIALLSENFKASDWCDQEAGIAVSRGEDVLIFPFWLGRTEPYGFICKSQGKPLPSSQDKIIDAILNPMVERFPPDKIVHHLVIALGEVDKREEALKAMKRVDRFLDNLSQDDIERVKLIAKNNPIVRNEPRWQNNYLRRFIDRYRDNISQMEELILRQYTNARL